MNSPRESPGGAPAGRRTSVRHAWPLLLILALAAVMRGRDLRQPFVDTFSWREASTAMMADNFYRRSPNIFFPEVSWSGPGPSYQGREFQTVTYLASLLYRVVGERDWVGRAIGVAFGVWGVAALYLLTARVWGRPRALAAALVLALLPGAVFTDRSFLPDPGMVALVTTAAWLYVGYLQSERAGWLIAATAVGVLGVLTKLPGAAVLAPLAYATPAILGRRALAKPHLARLAAALAASLALIGAYYAWAVHVGHSYPPYHVAGEGNYVWDTGLREYLRQRYYLDALMTHLRNRLWTLPALGLLALALLVGPPAAAPTTTERRSARWFFHLWLLGVGVIYLIAARELIKNPWNLHVLSPAVSALIGHAVVTLGGIGGVSLRAPAALARMAVLVAALAAASLNAVKLLKYPYARESHSLGLALDRLAGPTDTVVTIPHSVGDPTAIYYSKRRGWLYPPPNATADWINFPPDDESALRLFEWLRGQGAGWLGIARGALDQGSPRLSFWEHHPRLIAHIRATCELRAEQGEWEIYRIEGERELAATRPAD